MNEEVVYWLFVISNLLFFIATFFLIIKIIKNRDLLKDYSPTGSTITFVAVLLTIIAFIFMENYASVLLSLTTLVLWLFASVYSIKNLILHNTYKDRGTDNATKGIRFKTKKDYRREVSMVQREMHHARPLRFGNR